MSGTILATWPRCPACKRMLVWRGTVTAPHYRCSACNLTYDASLTTTFEVAR